jgi:hypothetical protein
MRAILIVLLGCSLLWLVLQGFRSVRAGNDGSSEPAGYLMPAAPPPQLAAQPPRLEQPVPRSSPEESVPRDEVPAGPAPKPTSVPEHRAVQTSATPSDEIALASLLLHRIQDVPGYLAGPGKSLPAGRRDLALALHRLILGPQDEARRMAEDLESREGVLVSEYMYLKQALSSGQSAAPAAAQRDSPLVLAASLARVAREGETALAAGASREAARAFGELLFGEVCAPWKAERDSLRAWSDALARAQAGYRWNREGGWPSFSTTIEPGDSLISVRKRVLKDHPGLLLCTGQIERANELRGGVIHPGQVLRIPAGRAGVLVDLDAHWALYRLDEEVVTAWEVGVGKPGSETPPGQYLVGEKTSDPMWFRPGHAPVPYGDPENPLGTRWIAWQHSDGSNTSLGFHGTKDPGSIGEDLSQGCVRMRQQAIEELFEILPRGAAIVVQP